MKLEPFQNSPYRRLTVTRFECNLSNTLLHLHVHTANHHNFIFFICCRPWTTRFRPIENASSRTQFSAHFRNSFRRWNRSMRENLVETLTDLSQAESLINLQKTNGSPFFISEIHFLLREPWKPTWNETEEVNQILKSLLEILFSI